MELGDVVPLLTAAGALSELRLRGAGIDVLEGSRHASRKVALVAVLQVEEENDASNNSADRGIYITPKSVHIQEQDTAVLLCTLRNVDLANEPVWGSLLLLVASHVFVAATGPITPASFRQLRFLAHFRSWRVVDGENDEKNVLLLKELVPRTTWVALDLKIKEMDGLETPTAYFEHKLTNPPIHGVSVEDAETQMLVSDLLKPGMRDCLSIKSATLVAPSGFKTPQAFTSSKVLPHALDTIQPKALFGRFLSGGVVLHLLRSLAHSVASQSDIVLQRIVYNVQLNFWKLLLESAHEKYTDEIHARLSVYEKIEFNADFIVTITEHKMQSEKVSVVNAGQGQFSSFDEFGNLKRSVSQGSSNQNLLKEDSAASDRPTLNTGIFSFIKNRAERAFSKQFSGLSASSSTASNSSAVPSLNHIPEDEDAEHEDLVAANLETPEDLLHKYNACIASYQVPMQYINTPTEAMPVSENTLESIHQNALAEAKKLILPFLYDLRCTDVAYSEFASSGLDLSVGKRNFLRRVREVKRRFELANEAASSLFCSQLIQYLHGIVLRKNERDNEAQKQSMPRVARSTSTFIMPDSGDKNAVPLTRLPMELLTYKNNLEAMASQYTFVSRGPMASRVLIGFYQAVVSKRLLGFAQKEYNRFGDACDAKENKLADLEDSLENTQQLVQRHQKTNEEYSIKEAKSITAIEMQHKDEIADLEEAIRRANEKLETAMRDQQALYQRTMQATRKTINTIDQVAVKNRVFMGYLERFEKGHMFSKSWRQYYYVLDHSTLKCYKSKGAFEERSPPFERPITLTGYNVIKSRTDESKIKLIPPEAGQMLRFRAPASVGRDTWMKKFIEAAQLGR